MDGWCNTCNGAGRQASVGRRTVTGARGKVSMHELWERRSAREQPSGATVTPRARGQRDNWERTHLDMTLITVQNSRGFICTSRKDLRGTVQSHLFSSQMGTWC